MYGLTNVNANNEWAPIVVATDKNTHVTLRPHLSMTNPNSGLATADIMYTIELTVFASSGEKSYFRIKNTLLEKIGNNYRIKKKYIGVTHTFPMR